MEMEKYWATGEPVGKGRCVCNTGNCGNIFPQIRGSYSNVVGLPLYETVQLLESVKIKTDLTLFGYKNFIKF